VKQNLDDSRRKFYLREQLKAIRKELGDADGDAMGGGGGPGAGSSELEDLARKLELLPLPADVNRLVAKDMQRLHRMQPAQPEYNVVLSYLEFVVSLPWGDEEGEEGDDDNDDDDDDDDDDGVSEHGEGGDDDGSEEAEDEEEEGEGGGFVQQQQEGVEGREGLNGKDAEAAASGTQQKQQQQRRRQDATSDDAVDVDANEDGVWRDGGGGLKNGSSGGDERGDTSPAVHRSPEEQQQQQQQQEEEEHQHQQQLQRQQQHQQQQQRKQAKPIDLARARRVLDRDHFGLEVVKRRVLQYVKSLTLVALTRCMVPCYT
jgi:hypothetical protein